MKAFVIYLPDFPASVQTSQQMIDPLKQMGFDVVLFEGTRGDQAVIMCKHQGRTLHPIGWDGKPTEDHPMVHNIGVIGCFMSHYRLWQKCIEINEPIWIFEDDVRFIRPYYPVPFDEVLITVLGKWTDLYSRDVYQDPECEPHAQEYDAPCIQGTSGYAITPVAAKKLVEEYRHSFTASDHAIRKPVVDIKIHSHIIGEMLDEKDGKQSLTKSNDLWVHYIRQSKNTH